MKSIRYLLVSFLVSLAAAAVAPELPLSDFTIYWKSAETVIQGGDPYALPHQATYQRSDTPLPERIKDVPGFQVYGPPATIGTVLIFGLFSQTDAKRLFIFGFVFSILFALRGGLVLLPLLPIGAAYLELMWGGPAWIALIGVCCCIALAKSGRDFAAGICLSLVAIKPHLFVLPLCYLLFSSLYGVRRKILFGVLTGGSFLSIVPMVFQPKIYSMYWGLISGDQPLRYFNATIPSFLSNCVAIDSKAALFLPLAAAILLLLIFARKMAAIEFTSALLLLFPLSLSLAPYAWIHDYAVLIPSTIVLWRKVGFPITVKGACLALPLSAIAVLDKASAIWKSYYTIDWYLMIAAFYMFSALLVLVGELSRIGERSSLSGAGTR